MRRRLTEAPSLWTQCRQCHRLSICSELLHIWLDRSEIGWKTQQQIWLGDELVCLIFWNCAVSSVIEAVIFKAVFLCQFWPRVLDVTESFLFVAESYLACCFCLFMLKTSWRWGWFIYEDADDYSFPTKLVVVRAEGEPGLLEISKARGQLPLKWWSVPRIMISWH